MRIDRDLDVNILVADPAAPTVTPQGAAGATSYSYKVVAVNASGSRTAASAAGSTASGNATLDGTNFNRITWSAVPGAVSYEVWRTVGGATQGQIGTTTSPTVQFDDTGLVADGETEPATNSTGVGTASPVLGATQMVCQFGGGGSAFSATLVLEGTVNPDRTEWVSVTPAVASVAALVNVAYPYLEAVRVRMTAYASGAPTAYLVGGRD